MYTIYGITDCPACLRAQAWCMQRNEEYVFVMMDFAERERQRIKIEKRWDTFPIIMHGTGGDERLIGGFDELLVEDLNGSMQ